MREADPGDICNTHQRERLRRKENDGRHEPVDEGGIGFRRQAGQQCVRNPDGRSRWNQTQRLQQ